MKTWGQVREQLSATKRRGTPEEQALRYFADARKEYESDSDSFTAAWAYLRHHPIFWGTDPRLSYFPLALDMDVALVEDDTASTGNNEASAPRHLIWVEAGPTYRRGEPGSETYGWDDHHGDVAWNIHDPRLDARAATFEQAIVALAANVRTFYSDDRTQVYEPRQTA